jgi:hypothetical protein
MTQVSGAQPSGTSQGRPVAVTIICIVGLIGALINLSLLFTDAVAQVAPWFFPFFGISSLIGLLCLIGLWLMRRWALYAYTTFAVIDQAILLATGIWHPVALVVPAIVVIGMFIHWSRMR